ncbi:DUF429 domain-containing protein, partial [Paenibacillus sp. TAF58]
TLSTIAWLDVNNKEFILDCYIPSSSTPLPVFPAGGVVKFIGFDCPQGLPTLGNLRRDCDARANTPSRNIAQTRATISAMRSYSQLVQLGVDLFWNAYSSSSASVYGLNSIQGKTEIFEVYPRFSIINLLKITNPLKTIPSKIKNPLEYIDFVWMKINNIGYSCSSVIRPTVDQVDAMLCAITADHLLKGTANNIVGNMPILDNSDMVIREGLIISP